MNIPTNPIEFLLVAIAKVTAWNSDLNGTTYVWCFPAYDCKRKPDGSKGPRSILKMWADLFGMGHFKFSAAIKREATALVQAGKPEHTAYYMATVQAGIKAGKLEERHIRKGWQIKDAATVEPEREARQVKSRTAQDIAQELTL